MDVFHLVTGDVLREGMVVLVEQPIGLLAQSDMVHVHTGGKHVQLLLIVDLPVDGQVGVRQLLLRLRVVLLDHKGGFFLRLNAPVDIQVVGLLLEPVAEFACRKGLESMDGEGEGRENNFNEFNQDRYGSSLR